MKKQQQNKKLAIARQTIQLLNVEKLNKINAGKMQEAVGTTIYVSIAIATQTLSDAKCIWACAQL